MAVVFEELVGGSGFYDHKTGTVHVATGLPGDDRRSTLAHEGVHRTLGHYPRFEDTSASRTQRELATDRLAARQLIPFPMLLDAMTKFSTIGDRTAFLGVDEDTFCARIYGLNALEQTIIEVCSRMCIGRCPGWLAASVPPLDGSSSFSLTA